MSLELVIAVSPAVKSLCHLAIPANQRGEQTMHTSSLRRTVGRRRGAILALPVLAAAGALTLTACSQGAAASPGSGPVSGSTSPSSSTGSAPAGSGTALAVRSTSLGTILTDGRGFTLYAFEADKGTTSKCSGACATAWP